MRRRFWLLGSAAFLFAPHTEGRAAGGPTITTASELATAYRMRIEPFWDTGRPIEFLSTRGANIHIHGRYFPRDGATTAIVIASGRTECMLKYKELIYDLHRNGYAVFIHDLRGQGFSSRLLADPMIGHVDVFDDYVADLKTLFDNHVKPTGHNNHVLLSHSTGGCISSLYLARYKRDFACAVMASPMHAPVLPAHPILAVPLLRLAIGTGFGAHYIPFGTPYRHQRAFSNDAGIFTHSPERWTIIYDAYAEHPTESRLGSPSNRWVLNAYLAGQEAQAQAGAIETPILLLQAGDDTIVDNDAQNAFTMRLNAVRPNGCIVRRIEGARHEMFIESDEYRSAALGHMFAYLTERLP